MHSTILDDLRIKYKIFAKWFACSRIEIPKSIANKKIDKKANDSFLSIEFQPVRYNLQVGL